MNNKDTTEYEKQREFDERMAKLQSDTTVTDGMNRMEKLLAEIKKKLQELTQKG